MKRPFRNIEPRVMVIVASDTVSGPVKGIFQLLQDNANQNVFYHLYNFRTNQKKPTSFVNEAKQRGIDIHLFKNGAKPYLSLLTQAGREACKKQVNIVQTHGYKASMIGLFLKFRYGIRWVCSMHGRTCEDFKVQVYQQLDRLVQNFADRVVFVSKAERDNTFCRRPNERTRIVYNTIDTDHPAPVSQDKARIRQKLGVPEDSKVVSVIARLSPEKGVDVFIRAFADIAAIIPEARAFIVGDGQERHAIKNQLRELGLADKVLLTGHTETPGDFILASDLIVLPSRYEGLPNVALEAMAFKKPVVATRVGGVPELVDDRTSGLLVPPEDSSALSGAMLEVLNDPSLARRLAEEGHRRLQRDFLSMSRARAWLSIYQELLEA